MGFKQGLDRAATLRDSTTVPVFLIRRGDSPSEAVCHFCERMQALLLAATQTRTTFSFCQIHSSFPGRGVGCPLALLGLRLSIFALLCFLFLFVLLRQDVAWAGLILMAALMF